MIFSCSNLLFYMPWGFKNQWKVDFSMHVAWKLRKKLQIHENTSQGAPLENSPGVPDAVLCGSFPWWAIGILRSLDVFSFFLQQRLFFFAAEVFHSTTKHIYIYIYIQLCYFCCCVYNFCSKKVENKKCVSSPKKLSAFCVHNFFLFLFVDVWNWKMRSKPLPDLSGASRTSLDFSGLYGILRSIDCTRFCLKLFFFSTDDIKTIYIYVYKYICVCIHTLKYM